MDHEELKERLYELGDAELDPRTRRELEAHLGLCPECRGASERWRRLGALFSDGAKAPPSFVQDVMTRLPPAGAPSPWSPWLWRVPALGLSLAAALLALNWTGDVEEVSAEALLAAAFAEFPSPGPEELFGIALEEP